MFLVDALAEVAGFVLLDSLEEQDLCSCEAEPPECMTVHQRIVHSNFVSFLVTAFVSAEQIRGSNQHDSGLLAVSCSLGFCRLVSNGSC